MITERCSNPTFLNAMMTCRWLYELLLTQRCDRFQERRKKVCYNLNYYLDKLPVQWTLTIRGRTYQNMKEDYPWYVIDKDVVKKIYSNLSRTSEEDNVLRIYFKDHPEHSEEIALYRAERYPRYFECMLDEHKQLESVQLQTLALVVKSDMHGIVPHFPRPLSLAVRQRIMELNIVYAYEHDLIDPMTREICMQLVMLDYRFFGQAELAPWITPEFIEEYLQKYYDEKMQRMMIKLTNKVHNRRMDIMGLI